LVAGSKKGYASDAAGGAPEQIEGREKKAMPKMVYVCRFPAGAQHKVYLVDDPAEEKNADLILGAEKIDYPDPKSVRVFLVSDPAEAGIHITKANFPK
jgi:hypothetical protein